MQLLREATPYSNVVGTPPASPLPSALPEHLKCSALMPLVSCHRDVLTQSRRNLGAISVSSTFLPSARCLQRRWGAAPFTLAPTSRGITIGKAANWDPGWITVTVLTTPCDLFTNVSVTFWEPHPLRIPAPAATISISAQKLRQPMMSRRADLLADAATPDGSSCRAAHAGNDARICRLHRARTALSAF